MTDAAPHAALALLDRSSDELRSLAFALREVEEKLAKIMSSREDHLDTSDHKTIQDIDRIVQSLEAMSKFLPLAFSGGVDPDNCTLEKALEAITLHDLRDRLSGSFPQPSPTHPPELF